MPSLCHPFHHVPVHEDHLVEDHLVEDHLVEARLLLFRLFMTASESHQANQANQANHRKYDDGSRKKFANDTHSNTLTHVATHVHARGQWNRIIVQRRVPRPKLYVQEYLKQSFTNLCGYLVSWSMELLQHGAATVWSCYSIELLRHGAAMARPTFSMR